MELALFSSLLAVSHIGIIVKELEKNSSDLRLTIDSVTFAQILLHGNKCTLLGGECQSKNSMSITDSNLTTSLANWIQQKKF